MVFFGPRHKNAQCVFGKESTILFKLAYKSLFCTVIFVFLAKLNVFIILSMNQYWFLEPEHQGFVSIKGGECTFKACKVIDSTSYKNTQNQKWRDLLQQLFVNNKRKYESNLLSMKFRGILLIKAIMFTIEKDGTITLFAMTYSSSIFCSFPQAEVS